MTERELVERHRGLVWGMVHRVRRGAPDRVGAEREDLYAAGVVGLWRAWQRWDSTRGVSFVTFAGHCILGAIRDELRRMDPLPRSVRRQMRDQAPGQEGARAFAATVSLEALRQVGRDFAAESVEEADGETLARVRGMIPLLPLRMRQVLTLTVVHELKQSEVARLLGIMPATVSLTRKNAIDRLRGMLRGRQAA